MQTKKEEVKSSSIILPKDWKHNQLPQFSLLIVIAALLIGCSSCPLWFIIIVTIVVGSTFISGLIRGLLYFRRRRK